MESSLPKHPLLHSLPLFAFVSLLLLIHPLSAFARKHAPPPAKHEHLSYHNGPLLTGNINLAIMWYGDWKEPQKNDILKFIESLNNERNVSFEPSVAQWWHKVESYQLVANKDLKTAPAIQVKVVKQVDHDPDKYSVQLSSSSYLDLVSQLQAGAAANTVAVVFASKDVQVEGTCNGPCYIHGVVPGKQQQQVVYIVVGSPGKDCPTGRCTSPFTAAEDAFLPRLLVSPPNHDEDVDAKIIHFAAALAATVTNPYSNGFFGGPAGSLVDVKQGSVQAGEAGSACFGVFGSGSFPGYAGRIRIDPMSGAQFNAHGVDLSRFLLPAIWDPKESTCWTTV